MPRPAAWQNYLSTTAAVLVAALFLIAGIWKMTDPIEAGARMAQARVPGFLSEYAAVGFGAFETFAAILILIPRYRKLGAWLIGAMLVAFMIWVGYFYNELVGKECSCFPWIKRAVGPGFFIGDAVMLALAALAGWWSALHLDWKRPAAILAALSIFGVASYAYSLSKLTGTMAPESVTLADGKPHNLRDGKQLVYFFDPQCMYCFHASQSMSRLKFGDTVVTYLPTETKQFANQFLKDTGMQAQVSNEAEKLKAVFPFGNPPYLVLLENGRQKGAINKFEEPAFSQQLVDLGYASRPEAAKLN